MPRYLLVPAEGVQAEDLPTLRDVDVPQMIIPQSSSSVIQPHRQQSASASKHEIAHRKQPLTASQDLTLSKSVTIKQSSARNKQSPAPPQTNAPSKIASAKNVRLWNVTTRMLPLVDNQSKAQRLIRFLGKHGVQMTSDGDLSYKDKIYHGTNLEELFCDAVDGVRRKPPPNYPIFYDILKDLNVNWNLFSQKRVRYLKK